MTFRMILRMVGEFGPLELISLGKKKKKNPCAKRAWDKGPMLLPKILTKKPYEI